MSTIISFLTDFGLVDSSVGQCKGAIAAIAPKAVVIDIGHNVPHYDIRAGSWMLRHAVPHFPPSVHVAVVDPGVGTARREIAIECVRGDLLIGPDNGLLLDAATVLGGIVGVTLLQDPKFRHQPVSSTFHARDIFCPAAAHIIHGVTVHLMGPQVDPDSLVALPSRETSLVDGVLRTHVAYVNEYGSLALEAAGPIPDAWKGATSVAVTVGNRTVEVEVVSTFGAAAVGSNLLLVDSYGQLCLAQNQGSLAAELGIRPGESPEVVLQVTAPSTAPS